MCFFFASLKAPKNMTLIFVSRLLESAQKTSIKLFASFKKLKKQEFDFFFKLKYMNIIVCKLKTLRKVILATITLTKGNLR